MSAVPCEDDRMKGFDDFESHLGDELRGERATLGKSLLDVQRDLRIKAAYISAIENCDPSVFPNQGFVAGYVRSYARYLKLDPDAMFERFCQESGFKGVNSGMLPEKSSKRSERKSLHSHDAELKPKFVGNVVPSRESFLNSISPSGIASVFVLVCLIAGLGFGGWSILKDIQRVEFAPVDQTPGVLADAPGFANADETSFETASAETVLNPVQDPDADVLGRLYRPQELAVPKMEPRDGPIAAIDPDEVGLFQVANIPVIEPAAAETVSNELIAELAQGPIVTIAEEKTEVELLAARAAWVRVHLEDGTVLFEKILEKGERYTVPEDAVNPLLRAGNSGSVYVLVNNTAYGPVGTGTSVAKNFALNSDDVTTVLAEATEITIPAEINLDTANSQ